MKKGFILIFLSIFTFSLLFAGGSSIGVSSEAMNWINIQLKNLTGYNIIWLPPISLNKPFKSGSTIPVKFSVHNSETDEFIVDDLLIWEVIDSNGLLVFKASYGDEPGELRVDLEEKYYYVNFQTPRHSTNYQGRVRQKNCIDCHNLGESPQIGTIDVNAFQNGFHGSIDTIPGEDFADVEPCWACHGDGQPPSGQHHAKYKNPKNCYDCHAYDKLNPLTKKGNYTAPIVLSHTRNATWDTGARAKASCEECHANSVLTTADPYIQSTKANISHYGTSINLPNTSVCEYCHLNRTIATIWGNAIVLPERATHHRGEEGPYADPNTSFDCWRCHVAIKIGFNPDWDDPNSIAGYQPRTSFHDHVADEGIGIFRYVESCYQTGCHAWVW